MKRLLASSIVVAMLATATPAWAVGGFGDVFSGRFYTTAVQWMVDEEITTGTSRACFSPDDPVTRGQAAAFLWRMEGFPDGAPPHPFTDVVADWQQTPVSWMFDEDITTGTSATTYSPDDTLTRGQMAALIHRAAGEPGGAPPHPFVDVVKDWQQGPVSWMADEEITTGTSPTMFSPEDPVTRGQFATFAYRWKGEPETVLDGSSPLCLGIDPFDGGLAQGWAWDMDDPSKYSFAAMPGYVTITQGGGGPDDFGMFQLLRDPVSDDYEIETKVDAMTEGAFHQAGLIVRPTVQDDGALEAIIVSVGDDGTGIGFWMNDTIQGDERFTDDLIGSYADPSFDGEAWLRIRHEGGTYTGSYSLDGTTWTEIGSFDAAYADPIYGIGAGIGANTITADYDYFMETPV